MGGRRATLIGLFASATLIDCSSELPPYGEAVLEVDTDAPAPSLANRLRIDIFREDGKWLESRDVARPDRQDWPVSFGVFSRDESKSSRVLVRLRAYAEGAVRDYVGERPADPAFVEPRPSTDLASLCRDAPRLEGTRSEITQRRGKDPITTTPKCTSPVTTGSVAVKLTVPTADDYKIKVVSAEPARGTVRLVPLAWSIVVRRTCDDPTTDLACAERTAPTAGAAIPEGIDPELVVRLEPGEYTVLTAGNAHFQPADLTVRVKRVSEWDAPRDLEAMPPPSPAALVAAEPSFIVPKNEPEPGSTIDRLVLMTLEPGQRSRFRIDLHGECFGRAAELGPKDGLVSLDAAKTCIASGSLEPVVVEHPRRDPSEPTKAGAFAPVDLCKGEWPRNGVACIPAGVFSFGGPEFRGLEESSGVPSRVARMPKFYFDVDEVSVARYREALGRGFVSPDPRSPVVNDGAFGTAVPEIEGVAQTVLCSWTSKPGDRERLPLSCVSWYFARAFCQFEGGDLPTEAEWEYVASAAGREAKDSHAWGRPKFAPRCDEATFARAPALLTGGGVCSEIGFSPAPVDAPGSRDVTPFTFVRGLAGNVTEWVLDSAKPFTSACWRDATVTSPRCWEENASMRSVRGGNWLGIPDTLRSAFRSRLDPGKVYDGTGGFRCAYRSPPR